MSSCTSSNDFVRSPNIDLISSSDIPSSFSFLYKSIWENASLTFLDISSFNLLYSFSETFKSMSAEMRNALPRFVNSLYWEPISRMRFATDASSGRISEAFHPTFCAASLKYLRVADNAVSFDSVLINSLYLEFISFNREMRSCNMSLCALSCLILFFLASTSKGLTPKAKASWVAACFNSLTLAFTLATEITIWFAPISPALNIFRIVSSTVIVGEFLPTAASLFSTSFQDFAAFAAWSPFPRKPSKALSSSISLTTRLMPYFFFAKKSLI